MLNLYDDTNSLKKKRLIMLCGIKQGESAIIHHVSDDNENGIRLRQLGFIPNTIITKLFDAPFGDPTAYLIRHYIIALRKSDAEKITVMYEK